MSSCICMRLMYQRRFRGMVQFGTPERARSLRNCGETSWFARNRYILAMLPWLPAEFDPGVHLIWANYGSQLCLHWLVNVLPFKTSKNWVDMYSQCVLCISFFMCVCVCAFGYSYGESSQHASLVPGRTNTAMILACMVGFVVLKSRCRAWKPWPWVTWSESIWELDDAAMPLCIYIYIYSDRLKDRIFFTTRHASEKITIGLPLGKNTTR